MFSDAAEESSVLLRLKRVSGVFHPGVCALLLACLDLLEELI
jgi:hypothetical protein